MFFQVSSRAIISYLSGCRSCAKICDVNLNWKLQRNLSSPLHLFIAIKSKYTIYRIGTGKIVREWGNFWKSVPYNWEHRRIISDKSFVQQFFSPHGKRFEQLLFISSQILFRINSWIFAVRIMRTNETIFSLSIQNSNLARIPFVSSILLHPPLIISV